MAVGSCCQKADCFLQSLDWNHRTVRLLLIWIHSIWHWTVRCISSPNCPMISTFVLLETPLLHFVFRLTRLSGQRPLDYSVTSSLWLQRTPLLTMISYTHRTIRWLLQSCLQKTASVDFCLQPSLDCLMTSSDSPVIPLMLELYDFMIFLLSCCNS